MYEEIIEANPDVKINSVLELGIKLKILIIDDSETISFETVPWKE